LQNETAYEVEGLLEYVQRLEYQTTKKDVMILLSKVYGKRGMQEKGLEVFARAR
jgi:hypothetical protein